MPKPHMCDPSLFEQDLSGRRYVVTGANSGIGLVTAVQLAKQGAEVIMGCRRVAEAQQRASEAGPVAGSLTPQELDLGNLASVRAFAAKVGNEPLHGLINNAGVMNTPQGRTADGFETQLGVNHLGHFLLTNLLLDALKQGAPSRIVNVSSCYHDVAMGREGDIHFDDLQFEARKYDGWEAYAQSKLANVLHARELAKRLEGTGVTAVSVHPGWVRTNLIRNSMPVWLQDTIARPVMRWMGMIEPWEGAQTTLHAALDPSVPEHAGAYFSQLGIYRDKQYAGGGWPMASPNPRAHDDEAAEKLWQISESLVSAA